MKTSSEQLIHQLRQITLTNINDAEEFKKLSDESLNQRKNSTSWSILECIEHLNLYGDFYLPEIEKRIKDNQHSTAVKNFKSGLIGDYFAKMMLPGAKKMKTFKDKDPIGSSLSRASIDKFIQQQERTVELLEKSRNSNLNKIKTAISISKWMKLKLGDTLRVVIYHNLRHIEQAKQISSLISK